MNKALLILGPTGIGKSSLAIKLAKIFNGEIISADSVQIFRGLDIGSAKIKKEDMDGVVHHAIDILPANAEFSVFEFVEMTKRLIAEISSRDKLPIIAGGTGLYIKALVEGYDFGGQGKNAEFRAELKQKSNQELMSILQQKDSVRASQIALADTKKIIRAIEIATFGHTATSAPPDIDFKIIALSMDREKLYQKINARVDQMLQEGLIEEVENLKKAGLTRENQSMQAIGYKEVLDFLNGQINKEEMLELIKRHTRNYAKRQLTFLRGMKVKFFDRNDEEKIIKEIGEWI